ncbi:MAG: ATP-binding protein [Anaerolineae bacterium]
MMSTWRWNTQEQDVPVVDVERCLACRRCAARAVCRPKALIQLDPGEPPMIDAGRCFGCLACAQVCPGGAIVPRRP